jgi:hypothetical protein
MFELPFGLQSGLMYCQTNNFAIKVAYNYHFGVGIKFVVIVYVGKKFSGKNQISMLLTVEHAGISISKHK